MMGFITLYMDYGGFKINGIKTTTLYYRNMQQ